MGTHAHQKWEHGACNMAHALHGYLSWMFDGSDTSIKVSSRQWFPDASNLRVSVPSSYSWFQWNCILGVSFETFRGEDKTGWEVDTSREHPWWKATFDDRNNIPYCVYAFEQVYNVCLSVCLLVRMCSHCYMFSPPYQGWDNCLLEPAIFVVVLAEYL